MLLSGRVAIITGGARGIGKGIALKFADEGCAVAIADILEAEAKETLGELSKKGGEGIFVQCDVSNRRQVEDMVSQVINKFKKVDILINDAGIGQSKSIFNISEEVWDKELNINLKGVFLCCKAVAPHMKEKGYGKIVNISSIAAVSPMRHYPQYCASKAGVLGLTYELAIELGPFNICVNAICPGVIVTKLYEQLVPPGSSLDDLVAQIVEKNEVPLRRVGTPEDIARAALFLASELSSYITGDRLFVSGGTPLRAPTKN